MLLRSTVDWSAVIWASLIAGTVSFLLYLFFVPMSVGAGNAAIIARFMASILLGIGALAPPATFDIGIVVAALVVHFALALLMGSIIAFVLHRWGLLTGMIGGALFGILFYVINFYSLTLFWPQMYALAHMSVLLVHVVFGALAGGIYEWLEFEPGELEALERNT